MFNEKKVKFISKNGEEIEGDILLTFDDGVTGNSYVIYTDNTKNENGELQIYSSKYELNEDKIDLYDLNEEEISDVNQVIDKIREQLMIDDSSFN